MELRQLEYFATIARSGGFRPAARALSVSPANLSTQIKFLERELGVRLFERGGREVTLTEAGRTLLARADRALLELRTAREEMLDLSHLERGELRIGALPGQGTLWLPNFLIAFLQRYPHVNLSLVERYSGLLLSLLDSGELHAASVLLPATGGVIPEGVNIRRVSTLDLVVVVGHQHPLAEQSSIRLEQLANYPLILTSTEEAPRLIVDEAFKALGIVPDIRFEANDPNILLRLTGAGLGVGITGTALARNNPSLVVPLVFEPEPLRYSIAVAWSEEHGPHTRALSSFLDFFADWWLRNQVPALLRTQSRLAPPVLSS